MVRINQYLSLLHKKASSLPLSPGCYLMKNARGDIIYVGKAKELKKRVLSYFQLNAKNVKTQILVSHVVDFDFMVCRSEAESLILENNLIKKYYPKYNIRLKDDKSYPYAVVNLDEPFPRIRFVRRPTRKKNQQLFGPFPTGTNIFAVIKILNKVFQLRDCTIEEFNRRKTPCLLFQIHQCSAPCVQLIDQKSYLLKLDQAKSFFGGLKKSQKVIKTLQEEMVTLAEREEFERAAIIRDGLIALEEFATKTYQQNVELAEEVSFDAISFFEGHQEVDLCFYSVRQGNLIGQKNFFFSTSDMMETLEEELIRLIFQIYSQQEDVVPQKIILDFEKDKIELLQESFATDLEFQTMKIHVVGKQSKYATLLSNVKMQASQEQELRQKTQESVFVGLSKLQELVGLKNRPKVLECYDIAIWQGDSPTASQVVFHDGKPEKKLYRHYHLKKLPEGNNDFAMMQEVFERRLKNGDWPDLFIVDGGVAQVNAVAKILNENSVDIPVVGIAKARNLKEGRLLNYRKKIKSTDDSTEEKADESTTDQSDERLIIPGRLNPYVLTKCPSLFKIIVQMRNEAHRFSRRLHHHAEEKRIIKSWATEIKGLNENNKIELVKKLELSQEEYKAMDFSQLKESLSLPDDIIKKIWKHLQKM